MGRRKRKKEIEGEPMKRRAIQQPEESNVNRGIIELTLPTNNPALLAAGISRVRNG